MSLSWQDSLALVLVAVAAMYVAWRTWLAVFRRRAAGCGSGCGKCAADSPKAVMQIEQTGQVSNLPSVGQVSKLPRNKAG
jgi:hypothetical protein